MTQKLPATHQAAFVPESAETRPRLKVYVSPVPTPARYAPKRLTTPQRKVVDRRTGVVYCRIVPGE